MNKLNNTRVDNYFATLCSCAEEVGVSALDVLCADMILKYGTAADEIDVVNKGASLAAKYVEVMSRKDSVS